MNLLLTDRLTCPRCAAGAGLILLADRVQGRRVLAGQLGCPHCRVRYPVVEGAADFAGTPAAEEGDAETAEAETLAALLGVTEGPAMLLMLGGFEAVARSLAALIPDTEVVVARAELAAPRDEDGVSMLRIAGKIPLYDGSMRGVVVARSALHLVAEAARVCALAARIVLLGTTSEARDALAAQGLQVLTESADILVAVRRA
jgi:uncharacterized protein YbaR (Trm112 family)